MSDVSGGQDVVSDTKVARLHQGFEIVASQARDPAALQTAYAEASGVGRFFERLFNVVDYAMAQGGLEKLADLDLTPKQVVDVAKGLARGLTSIFDAERGTSLGAMDQARQRLTQNELDAQASVLALMIYMGRPKEEIQAHMQQHNLSWHSPYGVTGSTLFNAVLAKLNSTQRRDAQNKFREAYKPKNG